VPVDRRDLRRRLFNGVAEQAGYFTAAQAKQLGYSYQAQAHHVAAGNWLRVDRGLFRLAEWIADVHDELAYWNLWSKARAVVSHETALAVHGIGEFESSRVHLTVPPRFTMRHDALVLHVADLPNTDVVQRTGFRITSVTRSVIDVAGRSPDEDQLSRVISEAQQQGLLSLRSLRSRAEAVDVRAALNIERALHRAEAS
jgi:predicted transcriptional regulator of viral defense system